MELKSFRELLLKKAANDPTLQTLIDVMKDELIAEKVIESLEKMARPQASMGRSANAAITAYGNQMKNKDVEMMRDALAHHINHYRSALKNGKREIADQHLNKIVPLMHLAARAGAHSGGQLGLDYTPLEPWETNYTSTERCYRHRVLAPYTRRGISLHAGYQTTYRGFWRQSDGGTWGTSRRIVSGSITTEP